MPIVTTTTDVDDEGLAELLAPRTDLLDERAVGDGTFELDEGPFEHYRRTVAVASRPDGRHEVTQTTDFRLAIPVWRGLFNPLVKRGIRNPPPPGHTPWWMPPDKMDRRATEMLAILCAFAAITGYLGVLLSQTNTYFKEDFGASNSAISWVLTGVRLGALLALAVVWLADSRGRRRVLLWATYLGIVLTATGALAPGLVALGASQTVGRAFSAAIALLIAVMASEEMPAGGRAFAISVMAMAGALGAGAVVITLGFADLAPWAWRVYYVVPLALLWPVHRLSRKLHETRRFEVLEVRNEAEAEGLQAAAAPDPALARTHRRRLAMLAATALLFALFTTPASNFFNEFFRDERGFAGWQISVLQILTNLPGGIAIIVGGRLADRRGRRLIGAIGVIGGTGFTVLMYQAYGAPIWLFSTLATLIGAIAVPALGVYGPEMFPTASRGRTNGWLNVAGTVGSVAGLLLAGWLADTWGSFSPTMAVLAIGPALVAVIVIAFYPETAHRELEELNPEDTPAPHTTAELDELEEELAAFEGHAPAEHRLADHLRREDPDVHPP